MNYQQQQKHWLEEYWYIWVILIIIVAAVIIIAVSQTAQPPQHPNALIVHADVQTVDLIAYTSSNHTDVIRHIDWGTLDAGDSKTVYVYLWSGGTVDLTITATQWQPEGARDYLTFAYNIHRPKILQGQTVPINFTLTTSPDAPETTFNFTITISATESPQRWIAYYGAWSIYIDESNGDNPFYVATHPDTREIIIRSNYSDLLADIDEVEAH